MPELPTGTVTFLFTDIEGSTTLWEQHPAAARAALVRHDALVEQVVAEHAGHIVRPRGEGDSRFVVFARATDAVAAAAALQQALYTEAWSIPTPLRVRMALHTGEADLREGDYYGSAANRCARLRAVAHGGQTLLSLTTEQLVRGQLPAEVRLHDLGEHRLKDLQHSEHVFHLVMPDLPADFPALRSLDARPHNLPLQRDALIGREREVETVMTLLRRPNIGLVTLTGPGGTGKTRLSQQVAAELLDDFADGAWFVDLSPITDPALVASTIAQNLGLQEVVGQPPLQSLKVSLRDKQLLLVLDNFEHLLPAAPLVTDLLSAALALKILVTSREVLHLYGEHEYPVLPLALPDPTHLPTLDQLTQYAGVALFIQRAQSVKPEFQVTNETASSVAEICVRLDGLPLAIELAAARIKLFPPQALLARLESRLKLLTGGGRDRTARQQTLRGTIDWSYDLLDEATRGMFVQLGIFVGGFTLEAAEAICNAEGDIDMVDTVASLVDKSLVRQQDGEPRFTMLETIREYTLERLAASGQAAVLRERHARYFAAWVDAKAASIQEHRPVVVDQMAWAETMMTSANVDRSAGEDSTILEMGNLAATFTWIIDEGDLDLGVRWYHAGFWLTLINALGHSCQAWRRWHQVLLNGREALPLHGRAKTFNYIGLFAWYDHEYAQAAALLEEGLALTRTLDNPNELLEWLWHTADVYRDQDEYTRAAQLYEEALALAHALGKQEAIAITQHGLGELALLQEDYQRALAQAQTSLAVFHELGPHWMIGHALLNAGLAAAHQGDSELVAQYFDEGLSVARTYEVAGFILPRLVGFARLAASQGRPVRTARLLGAVEVLGGTDNLYSHAQHREYKRAIVTVRAALDPATRDAAWAEGQAMTLEQAIAYALDEAADG